MEKSKLRKIVFGVCIVIIVLSVLSFIWAAFTAENYHKVLEHYEKGSPELLIVQMWYSLYICVTIFNLIIICGTIFLFVYFYRNDFTITKEERESLSLKNKEKRKQAKIEKIQNRKARLEEQLNNLN